jgi:dihydroorotate dehydrogenase
LWAKRLYDSHASYDFNPITMMFTRALSVLAQSILRGLDPELAHSLTIKALSLVNVRAEPQPDDARLCVRTLGLEFPNPIGLAAGFDKNAQVTEAMLGFGFGFVEAGTVTPRPQEGNPKPRIFRLPEDHAVINRLGFNNQGVEAARRRMMRLQGRPGIRGINIGANKDSTDRVADYVKGFTALGPLASYVAVNISSPNTPGLRGLQNKSELEALLSAVVETRASLKTRIPLLLKIAPDLDDQACADIAEVVLAKGIDGLIVSNTTIARPSSLRNSRAAETGGLSGKPLFERSTEILRKMYRLTSGRIALIGVGGIASGADAYAKIRAGASLVQLYTALTYEGAGLVDKIKKDVVRLIERDGLKSITAAVGLDPR